VFIKGKIASLDLLVHSADVLISGGRSESAEDIELSFATNCLSRFVLNNALLELLRVPARASIVHIVAAGMPIGLDLNNIPPKGGSFQGHNIGQTAHDLYGFALLERLRDTNISVKILNPGMADTTIWRSTCDFARCSGRPVTCSRSWRSVHGLF
jgi:NAD(P)-dependent dehydrogenase (short-subunit alcohol dehydrogenase family)